MSSQAQPFSSLAAIRFMVVAAEINEEGREGLSWCNRPSSAISPINHDLALLKGGTALEASASLHGALLALHRSVLRPRREVEVAIPAGFRASFKKAAFQTVVILS